MIFSANPMTLNAKKGFFTGKKVFFTYFIFYFAVHRPPAGSAVSTNCQIPAFYHKEVPPLQGCLLDQVRYTEIKFPRHVKVFILNSRLISKILA